MANKDSFTPEEWTKILISPAVAGMAITAADPSGLWGMLKEAFASGSALAAVKGDANADPLVKAVVSNLENWDARSEIKDALAARFDDAKPGDVIPRALESLQEISQILDAKAPDDALAFKTWLQEISQTVAEAASEGGFLGFGGVRVSDAEKATLADIRKTLSLAT